MVQPKGFKVKGREDMVCQLKKALYGLKQAPRQWHQKFDMYLLGQGFVHSEANHCVYFKLVGNQFVALTLYADDMLIAE